MNFDEIQRRSREVFLQEATDLLVELEAGLLALEADPAQPAAIDRVFRAMHTLKGSGSTSGYPELSDFVHHVEDVYNAAREGRLQIDSRVIDLTLKLSDAISRYLAAPAAEAGAVLAGARGDLEALLAFLPAAGGAAKKPVPGAPSAAPTMRRFRIRFRPHPEFFQTGADPGMYLDELRTLGTCEVRGATDALPDLADLDAERCYLHWDIQLETTADAAAVRGVFAFAEGDCELDVDELPPLLPAGRRTWYLEFTLTGRTLAAPGVLDTLWIDLGKLGAHRVVQAPPRRDDQPMPGVWRVALDTDAEAEAINDVFAFMLDANPQLRTTPWTESEPAKATASPAAAPAVASEGAEPAGEPAEAAAMRAKTETLRVSADKLDRLVNLVGELVILRSQVGAACALLPTVPAALESASEGLLRLTTEMRDLVLNVRMMPIGETFNKFRRLTRDMSRELGKEVDLVIEGADTEMDKSVLDQLSDPLVHLVRNCLDHGLEPPAERAAAGKPRRGTLRMRAEQSGDRVGIVISDDGRGLNAEKIRAKAIARGLLAAEARPSDQELYQMIFLPGFSTADTVSQLSGRGVGLDVVKKRIELLRGTVELRTRPGQGTEIRLSLPLTLAIIEGLMVEIDGDRYILPLSIARETIELSQAQRAAGNGRNVVELRGELIPYLRLRDVFALPGAGPAVERVVIVELEDKRLGLAVDAVLGNHQTVLKSLGWLGQHVQVYSGATVLGDGRVALILDVPNLVAYAAARKRAGLGMEI
ncbi:MAG: chemotaxis protein CheA [Opitutae bacterium]|nr:chemotaxis protein CheA [Opitutae bacterium]